MIRGIIFDCFGVLYQGSLTALKNMCPPNRQAELADLNKQDDYGYITFDQYMQGAAELTGKTASELTQMVLKKHVRNTDLVDFVKDLNKDYRVALLSNVGNNTIECLFEPGELQRLFDAVVLSHQEHIIKPHPAIFELTAERLGLHPGECVMIDDLEPNCQGAEIAGMQSILFTTNDNLRRDLAKILSKH